MDFPGLSIFVVIIAFSLQLFRLLTLKSSKDTSLLMFLGLLVFLIISFSQYQGLHGVVFIIAQAVVVILNLLIILLVAFFRYFKKDMITSDEILEQLPGHVYWKDSECRLLGCNRNNWRDFGLTSLKAFIGKTDYDLFSKTEADRLRLIDEEVIRNGVTKVEEEWLTLPDGSSVLYLSHKTALKNKKNKIIGLVGYSFDITLSKKAMLDHLEMLENVIAVMPGNVYWMDTGGVYLGCNDNEAKFIGLKSRKEIIGKRNADISGFVIPEVLDPINEQVMRTGKKIVIEEPALLSNGEEAVFLSSKVPIHDSQGRVAGMVGISIDITDRKKAEKELRIEKDKAEAANKAKIEFLYNMRHDLRTPFSGILGLSEVLADSETDSEKKESLNCIAQSAKELLSHLNEILEFTKSEEGQLPILKKTFNIHKLVQNVVSMMKPSALERGLTFDLTIENEVPQHVIGDRIRLQKMLINLLSNAIKFTHKGGVTLEVQLEQKDTRNVTLKFIIIDTGIGIPEDKYNLIFEEFNRLTASYSGVYSGKGLGLRTVKHFLDEIGGEAFVESGMGKGSKFTILIPYKISLLHTESMG